MPIPDTLLIIMRQAIRRYLGDNPDGLEVTLAVLAAIGEVRMAQIHPKLGTAKQLVGRETAVQLSAMYGDRHQQLTSGHKNTWPALDWVNSYTRHRVLPR